MTQDKNFFDRYVGEKILNVENENHWTWVLYMFIGMRFCMHMNPILCMGECISIMSIITSDDKCYIVFKLKICIYFMELLDFMEFYIPCQYFITMWILLWNVYTMYYVLILLVHGQRWPNKRVQTTNNLLLTYLRYSGKWTLFQICLCY